MLTPLFIALIVAASLALMLLRPRGLPEVYWVGGGALLLLVCDLIPWRLAVHAAGEGTDVYLFLIGMMLLSELAREHGVFDWLSEVALRQAQGSSTRLFALIYLAGTLVTIFISNDATAVVLTPAILHATRKAKAPPLPYLFACALIANAASFVLPISNPANLVLFRGGVPPLAQWLLAFGLPSAASIATTYFVLRWIFRQDLRGRIQQSPESASKSMRLSAQGKLVLAGLAATVVGLLICSSFGRDLGLPACLIASLVAALVSWQAKASPWPLLKAISWSTLLLVAGLFILVAATESIGAQRLTGHALAWTANLAPAWGALLLGLTVGVANNLVNNLPLGLIVGSTLQTAHTHGLLANAALIGVDLGPNLSVTGSLATILWLLAIRRQGLQVTAWSFLRVGAIAMPVALLLALSAAILMQAVL